MPDLLQKIEDLKQKFVNPATPDDLIIIEGWESDAKRSLIIQHATNHEGMQALFQQLRNDVADMDVLLVSARSKELSDAERDRVLDRKDLYLKFLRFFNQAEAVLAGVAKSVDANLKDGQG